MMLTWIDWLVVAVPLLVVLAIAIKTQRYVRGVTDFLAAGRCGGRYLVCNALAEAGGGAIGVVALFEVIYKSGFTMSWWGAIGMPVGIVVYLSGYLYYRYRETRVLTMAQLFEVRYSRRFRIFTGMISYIAGIINYGIFPAVGARFFVYFCGFPDHFPLLGLTIPTFAVAMLVLLGISLPFTLLGGQLTAMVTDCIECLISSVIFMIIAGVLLYLFSWQTISESLANSPPGYSLLNPFAAWKISDFNLWYVLIGICVGGIYGPMSWQGNQGFNCAAVSPHEAKMGRILGGWRSQSRGLMITLLGICAYTFMHHGNFALGAKSVQQALQGIKSEDIRNQMTVPVALAYLLPVGIKGALCAVMLFMLISCDSSYLHSWGSILVQDVIMPLRKTPLAAKSHVRLLRCSIAFVAAFAYCFSLLFSQTSYILMFFAITGAIYMAGAGAVIIGGLYWRKGTTAGAWGAMIVGSIIALAGMAVDQTWQRRLAPALYKFFPDNVHLAHHLDKFPINGQWMSLGSACIAIAVYVTTSLLTCREDFNLERMLHRGRYAVDEQGNPLPAIIQPPRTWKNYLGIDGHFTRGDAFLAILLFFWNVFWFAVFLVVTIWNVWHPWPTKWWSVYWHFTAVQLACVIGLITTVWFTIGGVNDLRRIFLALRSTQENPQDDGTVPLTEECNGRKPNNNGRDVESIAAQ